MDLPSSSNKGRTRPQTHARFVCWAGCIAVKGSMLCDNSCSSLCIEDRFVHTWQLKPSVLLLLPPWCRTMLHMQSQVNHNGGQRDREPSTMPRVDTTDSGQASMMSTTHLHPKATHAAAPCTLCGGDCCAVAAVRLHMPPSHLHPNPAASQVGSMLACSVALNHQAACGLLCCPTSQSTWCRSSVC